jgi:zinc protease
MLMLDRALPPPYVQSTSYTLLEPDKKKLPNGVDLFFIHGGSQEVLKIELLFQAGRWFEGKWGASYFASHQLAKGTRSKTSFDIARLFDLYGAHLEINAGLDIVSISLYTLTKNLLPVLNLLSEILQEPVFPKKELEQSKSIYIQNLKVNYEKTSFLASKLFRKSVFGENHPYGKELEEHDIAALKREDLMEHFDSRLQDFSVFVAGKIERESELQIIEAFSAWQVRKAQVRMRDIPSFKPTRDYIEKENSVQSSIRTGRSSLVRTDPDYTDAVFVSHILGGYFGSRLMKNIREEKGLTYGIYASLHPLRHGSYLVVGADVNKENVTLTFEEIRKELKRLRTEKISTDELETARNHFIGSLQSELTTPFAHADKLKTIYLYGLPQDYYHEMILRIASIQASRIQEVGEKHFHEESFFEVAVG